MDFKDFKHPVAQQFARLCPHPLFRVEIEKDLLWQTYLDSFPSGTNPIFRERTEYDCSCCRQYIRAVGDVVAIVDGAMASIWDITSSEPAYQAVANALSALVKSKPITNVFLHTEASAGTDRNFEELTDGVRTWQHFHARLPSQAVCRGSDMGPRLSESRAWHDVFYRSLTEITADAVDTVLEVIAQNSLYRGAEHAATLNTFRTAQRAFALLQEDAERHNFAWVQTRSLPGSVTMIRNTAIGTLLVDLSEGMELEDAVKRFESVVAPKNYKRPTSLVTKKQIEAAKVTLQEMGLISALERRYARLDDINVNDILFADRSVRKALSNDVFDTLATKSGAPKNLDRVEEVPIETFVREILPRAESVEALVENRHTGNLVSLIAPANPTGNGLFKWDNKFSWSYNGDVADSIKERVKNAGGNVTGDLCCRLAWNNRDDLDLHMVEPTGYEIYYINRRHRSSCGGVLDVDANGADGLRENPVENIFYASRSTMLEGIYRLYVHQFCVRDAAKDVGFEAEIDYLGGVTRFAYPKAQRDRDNVPIATFKYTHAEGIEFIESLPSTQAARTVWDIKTQHFQRVNVVCLSPNYWGARGVGNRHYFFMLDGCRNDGAARGFYNEFLHESLTQHRKVIEMVGAKMRTDQSAEQLSGLGFSSTQRKDVLVRVKGSFTRTVKVVF